MQTSSCVRSLLGCFGRKSHGYRPLPVTQGSAILTTQEHHMNGAIEQSKPGSEVFWGEIAPCEHLVQIYADQGAFLDSLEGRDGRRVRAFGEMVAVMWTRGQSGATVQLEHLWHRFCQTKAFSLFCAYPKSGLPRIRMRRFAKSAPRIPG